MTTIHVVQRFMTGLFIMATALATKEYTGSISAEIMVGCGLIAIVGPLHEIIELIQKEKK